MKFREKFVATDLIEEIYINETLREKLLQLYLMKMIHVFTIVADAKEVSIFTEA